MNGRLVSVIVPVYKVEAYLDNCIQSILNQTYQNIEVILVDDGSPDKCPRMCDEYATKDPRIKVIHKKNGGLSDARNVGIRAATGKYLFCVDSDDTIDKETIECLVELAVKNNAQIVSTTKDKSNVDEQKNKNQFDVVVGTGEDIYMQILQRTVWEAWGKLIERELVKDMEYPIKMLYEDLGYVPYAFLRATKAVLIDNGMYHYTYREDSIMGNEKELVRVSDDLVKLVEKLIYYTKEKHPNVYNVTFTRCIRLLYGKYQEIEKNQENKKRNRDFIDSYKKLLHRVRRELFFKKGLGKRTRLKLIYMAYSA